MTQLKAVEVKTRKGTPQPKPGVISSMITKPGTPTYLRGLLFGPPKTGKTTVACSGGRTLLIEFDPDGEGTETLKGRDDVDVIRPINYGEVLKVINALKGGEGDYEWIVFDSLTFLFQMLAGDEITDTFIQNKDVRRAYGKAGAAVNSIISKGVTLPANVIFTAHLQVEAGEDVVAETQFGEHEVKVAVSPMIWKNLGPAVGFIGRTYRTKRYEKVNGVQKAVNKFMVSFNDGDRSPAGSRYSMNGEYEGTVTTLKDIAADVRKDVT